MTTIDLPRLLKLRLAVARHGEMDCARWWNTQGVLSARGALLYARGFPTSHPFARARLVMAVARARSAEVFSPPSAITLWSLPGPLEEAFDEHWSAWLDDAPTWLPFFDRLATHRGSDLLALLDDLRLLTPAHHAAYAGLRHSSENRAVLLPSTVTRPTDDTITLLAAAFARGEPGALAVPYARLESAEA